MVGQAQLTRFRCEACGTLHVKWVPRCSKCGQLKVRSEITSVLSAAAAAAAAASAAAPAIVPSSPVPAATPPPEPAKVTAIEPPPNLPVPISDVPEESYVRYRTGLDPLDDVLGGGLVKGSLVLLSAEPGSGKSTLLAQALDGMHIKCLYATGEESTAQAAHRARRLGADSPQVLIVAETRLEIVLDYAKEYNVDALAIDSIQTLAHSDVNGSAGSLAQIRQCAQKLMHFAKNTNGGIAVFVIAHVTHDGVIAGPKTLEHLVDTVLMLEVGDGNERTLRSSKNRFGDTARIGRMVMTSMGLEPAPFQATEDSDDSDDSGGGGILH